MVSFVERYEGERAKLCVAETWAGVAGGEDPGNVANPAPRPSCPCGRDDVAASAMTQIEDECSAALPATTPHTA